MYKSRPSVMNINNENLRHILLVFLAFVTRKSVNKFPSINPANLDLTCIN